MDTLSGQVGAVIWLGLCGLVLWRGARAERLAAGALVAAWLATLAVYTDAEALVPANPGWGVLVVDSVLLVVLLWIALRPDRPWLTLATGFQAIVVLVHVVTLADPRILTISYVVAQNISTFCVLICVVISAWQGARLRGAGRD